MDQQPGLNKHELLELVQLVAGLVGVSSQEATDRIFFLLDDIPGLELVSDEQKMVWVEEIWKLAVELRAGEEGRSRYPNSNGDHADDQDV